jgi:hypothetical protein
MISKSKAKQDESARTTSVAAATAAEDCEAYRPKAEEAKREGQKRGARRGGRTAGKGRPKQPCGEIPRKAKKQDESARTASVAAAAVAAEDCEAKMSKTAFTLTLEAPPDETDPGSIRRLRALLKTAGRRLRL